MEFAGNLREVQARVHQANGFKMAPLEGIQVALLSGRIPRARTDEA
jgi:hypothetical protein